jgi:peptidoglycan/xylan/chitin deacetylase (PgdA/CDA1 family)
VLRDADVATKQDLAAAKRDERSVRFVALESCPSSIRSSTISVVSPFEHVPGVVRFVWELPAAAADDRVIALTFDDGPHGRYTPGVLEPLAAAGVAASFFVIGEYVELHPDLMRALAAAGHTIGIHGWTHTRFTELTPAALDDELDRCIAAVLETAGVRPRYVRAPYGPIDATISDRLTARGLVPVKWSVDPEDWRHPQPGEIERHVVERLAPGQIVLLHDGMRDAETTIAALPGTIAAVRERGYRFVAL